MNSRHLRNLFYLLLALTIVPFAQAGPGGGTYYANSPAGGASGTALRKFVDSLPGVGPSNANNLGQYIPIATPVTGKPGVPNDGDYYEIGVVEYAEKMHSDLPKKTRMRGYVDLNPVFGASSSAHNRAHYLGPLIIAQRNRPVRVKMTNLLPTGAAGKLFIPTDTSIMGAGIGPKANNGTDCSVTRPDPSNPTIMVSENCSTNVSYTQNRATFHLHGGNSPWISDGTTHQWTAPAAEVTPYKKGVSTRDVPDMPASGDGSMTFFWTNQQSNRMMFYHDHSLGITRLNVYAGEAAGYLLTDPTEEGLINSGVLPNAGGVYRYGIPLIIQDKTFVPQNVDVQDSLWRLNSKGVANNWGIYGDLWFPHVYEPNQDPTSPVGANPFGRWDYGPWFWPPISIAADRSTLPEPTTTPEGFHDTMLVNGTAYPYLTVEPKAYRFRILNASNDRGLNLSLFYSDPNDPSGKEVKMVPAGPNPAFPAGPFPQAPVWPTDGRAGGVPDPGTVGPNIVQIGSESGFLPYPVIHPNQPVNYNYNRRDIVVLNVQEKNLFLGGAERADVIIDFSAVPPGSTLILYNDGPAPTPASDPRYDYYTGNPDFTSSGGAPSTVRGYGPNTRTVMQFRVAGTPGASLNMAALQSALPVAFKASQPAPLVTQPTLPVASGGYSPTEQYAKIQDYAITLTPLNSDYTPKYTPAIPVTIPFHPKAIQELWDPYGRMNATLGIELPFTNQFNQTTLPMGFAEPTTETTTDGQPQIWKITHNGVDTHPVHFHMVDVQVVNRVGWDGAIRQPDENELGWKETVRMNPLEDIVVAMRPKVQTLPASWTALNPDQNGLPLPKSIRNIDPALPPDARIIATDFGNIPIDPLFPRAQGTPAAGVVTTVANNDPSLTDYGYEYVWHCHILGHEENDFMRPFVFRVSTAAPLAPTFNTGGTPNVDQGGVFKGGATVPGKLNYIIPYTNPKINQVVLQWNDGALDPQSPSSFLISRATGAGAFANIAEVTYLPGYPPIYTDTSVDPGTQYRYQITAFNAKGSTAASDGPVAVTTGAWTNATGVTLVDSKPIGHVVGSNVQFTATGSGATVTQPVPAPVPPLVPAYQYRFLLNNVEVQAFSTLSYWTLPDTTPVGTYAIKVEARTSPAQAPVASATVTHVINNPAQPPVTVSSPAPGIYTATPVTVTLTAATAAPPATIFYTTDGSIPDVTTLTTFTNSGALVLNATTTINYFARDVNGVVEPVHSETWYAHTLDMTSSVSINGGATATNNSLATLNLSAVDPAGVSTMQFSNDNITYSAEEPFLSTKSWLLATGDGLKTVYVRFRDKSLPQPGGYLYPAVSSQIIFDSVPPITAISPIPGTYPPMSVTLAANETATIYYTVDGSTPTTSSTVYTVPILLAANTNLQYFAVDTAGNAEAVKSGLYTINVPNLTASVVINGGVQVTKLANVTLALSAVTSNTGGSITGMQFSNDGVNYIPATPESFAATKSWSLSSGDGLKTVYVRFTEQNSTGTITYPPVAASIILDTTAPTVTQSPIPGIYSSPVPVVLTANEAAVIYYTTDNTAPTTASSIYSAAIPVIATTTIQYMAVDTAGNQGTPASSTWTIQAPDLVSSLLINNGATHTNQTIVALSLSATSSTGVTTMQFSNDNINFTAEEPYAVTKSWTLTPGDGLKSVYVKFRDGAGGGGNLYAPITAQITLDTVAPSSSASPITGDYSTAPIPVTLTSNEPGKIYYTVDGTTPTTSSAVYTGPIQVATSTTINFFAVDRAGNNEAVMSGTWNIHTADLVASVSINNGATATNITAVTLTLSAFDATGINKMQFSNDGVNYTAEEAYVTSKTWNLIPGDALKTVYVRFRDGSLPTGNLYDPVTAQIALDTVAPLTTASPVTGVYSPLSPILVTLAASEAAKIYYTIDGTTPTTASPEYTSPITLAATTTVKYFAVDTAGNAEAVKFGTWTLNSSSSIVGSVKINSGAQATGSTTVTLTLNASDPVSGGISKMQFSNDGLVYSVEEPYAATKVWSLVPNDGVKTVYVRYRDKSLNAGILSAAVTAQITLDTVAPVTSAGPIPGSYSSAPVPIALTTNESSAIYYTTDGSIPSTNSTLYGGPISISTATPTTINYFAVDTAGNIESYKSGSWTFHTPDMVASVIISNGAAVTKNSNVTLSLSAVDAVSGIAEKMQFSNDGISYTAEEPYAATKTWPLTSGDGNKSVYVRFREKASAGGTLYDPVTAQIILDTTAPVTSTSLNPGTFAGPVQVSLTYNEPATIFYTVDGSDPSVTSNPARVAYSSAITVAATTTIRYSAVDPAGNFESVKSGVWTIHTPDMDASVQINNNAAVTNSPVVTLQLSAVDSQGVSKMQFSNDGVNYSAEEAFPVLPATTATKTWTISSGDGPKSVYVRFRDGSGLLYDPITTSILLDTVAPVTTAGPVTGSYSAVPVSVTLTSNEPGYIYYTTDGSTPTTSSILYTGAIQVNATTTIKYFAVDPAGNSETVKNGTWSIHDADLSASVKINNGAATTKAVAVSLTLNAVDATGINTMQFSNDGITYTAEETYATVKAWNLTSGDGLKTVYVRFRDGSLPTGNLYDPVTAQITLDTVTPITSATPITGTYATAPVNVALAANESSVTTYYTTDGTTPNTGSLIYTTPIVVAADTTIKYYSVDAAGNAEAVNSGTWNIHVPDMAVTVNINTGNAITNTSAVTLSVTAKDHMGVTSIQFSNDGVNYSAEEPFVVVADVLGTTSKAWTLSAGEGTKTVYIKLKDGSLPNGEPYGPFVATITYGQKDGILPGTTTYLGSAFRSLQIANKLVTATDLDLAHADIAPYVNGTPKPDGKIDLGDAYVLLLRAAGLIPL